MVRKIQRARELFKEQGHIFKCPHCGEEMKVERENRIFCLNNHSFDLARKGYVNFLSGSSHTKYDKEMLEARNRVFKRGFFDPLLEELKALIARGITPPTGELTVLDAGCGEGSLLARLLEGLTRESSLGFKRIRGVGIDISREGIQIAARDYQDIIWCVADVARAPFQERGFHLILNILSPSNYHEFNRILAPGGTVIKVIPGRDHLKELREIFYDDTKRDGYGGEEVMKAFKENFQVKDTFKLSYSYNSSLEGEKLEDVIKMTPLSWRAGEKERIRALKEGVDRVTVDLVVAAGKGFNSFHG